MTSLLIVSFSPVLRDPRVRRQIAELSRHYDVSVAGYGVAPTTSCEYTELPDPSLRPKLHKAFRLALVLRLFRLFYWWGQPQVRALRRYLSDHRFDAILVNDFEPLPAVLKSRGEARVVLDAHEFAPTQGLGSLRWTIANGPYSRWLCSSTIHEVDAMATVSEGLARAYRQEFQLTSDVEVVPNAPDYHLLAPSSVNDDAIELVYHGLAGRDRGLEILIDATVNAGSGFRLNLVLVPSGDVRYLHQLRQQVAELSCIRIHDPVALERIVEEINEFDVGLFVYPPRSIHHRFALPNKFFEFVQARLAVVTGPSPEMALPIRRYGLGVVMDTYTATELGHVLSELTGERVREFKAASDRAARELCWSTYSQRLRSLVVPPT